MISESTQIQLSSIDRWLAEHGQTRDDVIWCHSKAEIWVWYFINGKKEVIIETAYPELINQMVTLFPNLLNSDSFYSCDIQELFKDHIE